MKKSNEIYILCNCWGWSDDLTKKEYISVIYNGMDISMKNDHMRRLIFSILLLFIADVAVADCCGTIVFSITKNDKVLEILISTMSIQ